MSTSGGGVADLTARAHLNGAAIATLFSAPTQILASPGAGRAIVAPLTVFEFVPGLLSYVMASGGIVAAYAGGAVAADRQVCNQTDTLLTANPLTRNFFPNTANSNMVLTSVPTAHAVVIGADTADPTPQGPVATTTINAAGAGYAIDDTGVVNGNAYGAKATYVVVTVDGLGAVLTYTITSAGNGYDIVSNPHTCATGGAQPGVGVGLKLNVTALPAFDGDLYVTMFYDIVSTH